MKISKTTKQNIDYLSGVLTDLQRGIDFLLADDTVVTRVSHGTATNEYHCPHSAVWSVPAFVRPITKDIGSDLCYLYNAKHKLERFLDRAKNPLDISLDL